MQLHALDIVILPYFDVGSAEIRKLVDPGNTKQITLGGTGKKYFTFSLYLTTIFSH